MCDREKVIKGLECCMSDGAECYEPSSGKCPYYKDDTTASVCTDDLFYDVYALLKAQEPVVHGRWEEKRWTTDYDWGVMNHRAIVCSACDKEIYAGEKTPYCPNCGAKMDGRAENDTE